MTPDSQQPVLVVGTGAMACAVAARMASANIPVTMLGSWEDGLHELAVDGVRVVEDNGLEHRFPVQVIATPHDCQGVRLALVLVKSWQTPRAARQLAACMAPDGLALTLQNGLGNREQLMQALGARRVALGVTTLSAWLLSPGRVRTVGEAIVTLGAQPNLAPLTGLLQSAGFIIETATDPHALVWGKLVINAALNPITALLNIPTGELLARPSARALAQAVVREAAAVAVAQGIRLPYPDPVVAVETIARRTAGNLSSMLQDVQRGAPTEIDSINGAIVQAGEATGVPTPINRTLWQLVKALRPEGGPLA
ncbi:MAG: ketopantoate reductase family protein [Chloroflexota bacterium]